LRPAAGQQAGAEERTGRRRRRRRRLRDWPVRGRIIALIAVPTVLAIALGAVGTTEALRAATSDQRAHTLAELSSSVTALADNLQAEQTASAVYVAAGHGPAAASRLRATYRRTDADLEPVRATVDDVRGAYPSVTRQRTRTLQARLGALPRLRRSARASGKPAQVAAKYSDVIGDLLAIDDTIAAESGDPQLSRSARALGAVSRAKAELATQRSLVGAALAAGQITPGGLVALRGATAARQSAVREFRATATAAQQRAYARAVAGPEATKARGIRDRVISSRGAWISDAPPGAARTWSKAASGTIADVSTVEKGLVGSVSQRSAELYHATLGRAVVVGAITLAVVLVVLAGTLVIARSLVFPLRTLRSSALDVAETRLPGLVRRLAEESPETVDTSVEPIDVHSADEIGQVARAFDEVHRVASHSAGEQARLRNQLSALFVNLSRRSQTLVERQLDVIDTLESSESDPERLQSLFTLDHLATRMRRNGENLLVLGGQEPVRRFGEVMPLQDVLRAAASEVERYQRIEIDPDVPEVVVTEAAVSDLVHLLAELLENATTFSSPEDPVAVRARPAEEGGVVVEVADRGLGLSEEKRAAANTALADPPDLDTGVSRRMGLFVVARLARRHGIGVRLQPGDPAGLAVLVTLPPAIASALPRVNPQPAHTPTEDQPAPGWPGRRWITALNAPGAGPGGWFGGAPLRAIEEASANATASEPVPADLATEPSPPARGRTVAGLPVREPGANYVPGSLVAEEDRPAAEPEEAAAAEVEWEQSPEAIRARFASYQAGSRRGHQSGSPAAAPPPDHHEPAPLPVPQAPPNVDSPGIRQLTTAGLPVRTPGANYVPGTPVTARPEPLPPPSTQVRPRWEREPSAVAARFAAYQAGLRRGQWGAGHGDDAEAATVPLREESST
jgi:signal transduction histidine kinase